ncbi:NAD(P)-binding domain-containing protein [Nocardia pseudobrasiliensis]|uniref:Pyridine nucleotide-disulfide oxidoreductase n=1 Tax=Nocardia pseudobrasiliensis TaxID=45979 RepID=A0A370HPW0_9NOCA|nr:NAD(P)-binding domain-containing protein [Nocardia pseudobrasiliensis]RDI60350.1 pyridine nucleotide-disulfide oxidoreductase [Nocardia pseudobrasiliensis]
MRNGDLGELLDYLVVGAGPGGLQLGQWLRERGHSYRILERDAVAGSFFRTFPRHRQMISNNKRHTGTDDPELNLRMDWNSLLSPDPRMLFTRYSARYFPEADTMVRYLGDFAEAHELAVSYNTRVSRIARDTDGFVVTDEAGGQYRARRVVLATGVSVANTPAIPGIEHAEQYSTVPTDPEEFVDQRVLIIGKGNSAFETADNLIAHAAVIHVVGRSSIRLAWKTHYVGHLRAVNNNFLDTYELKSQNAVLDGEVLSIERDGDGYLVDVSFARADEVVKRLRYDRVIACTGFRFDASIFEPDTRPRLMIEDRFAELNPCYESVNVPGLYFAGTIMQQRDFKKSTTGFIHGFRYAVRALGHILDERHHDHPWPRRPLEPTADALADAVVARVNRTSALWQMFGVLGDVLLVPSSGPAHHLEEVPVDYAHESDYGCDYFTVTLEYGPDHDKVDPFDISVRRAAQNSPDQAIDASYLHPVIRHWHAGQLLDVHHMAENLENEWDDPRAHRAPLAGFFTRALASVSVGSGR